MKIVLSLYESSLRRNNILFFLAIQCGLNTHDIEKNEDFRSLKLLYELSGVDTLASNALKWYDYYAAISTLCYFHSDDDAYCTE